MKHLCTLLLAFCALKSLAQDADYYQKSYSQPIGSKPYNAESFLRKLGEVRILNRWYLGADGFIQKDRNTITNDFDGLIATESPTVTAWVLIWAGFTGNNMLSNSRITGPRCIIF